MACKSAPHGGIAVIVHAYYPDVFEHIAQALTHIPWSFDLYVSVPNGQARQQVWGICERLTLTTQINIRSTPNRGRDFAPFFVTYGEAIRAHRYVLHLHAKIPVFWA